MEGNVKRFGSSATPVLLLVLLSLFTATKNGGSVRTAEAHRRVSIPDELDDVADDEEDESWREWGRRSKPAPLEPPPDLSKMSPSEIQEVLMKSRTGLSYGFVKLRLGVRRSKEDVPEIAMKWTKILRTGSIEAKFTAFDLNTVMFTMERGQDTDELKDFILSQPEAYEMKVGDQVYRRPGDPPLEEVIEALHAKKNRADGFDSTSQAGFPEDEL